jgi:hypothetical protein
MNQYLIIIVMIIVVILINICKIYSREKSYNSTFAENYVPTEDCVRSVQGV